MDWDPKEHLPKLQIAYLHHFSKIVSLPEQYTFGLSSSPEQCHAINT